jgi:hypothetical protein
MELTVEAVVVVVVEEVEAVVEVFLAVEVVVGLMEVLVELAERIFGGKKLFGVPRAMKEDKTVIAVAIIEFSV